MHVLIYAAVRRVKHNFPDVKSFVDYYFGGYVVAEDSSTYGCPSGKSFCIMQGNLINSASLTVLLFRAAGNRAPEDHPLNKLVSELLMLIRSRYVVLDHKKGLASRKVQEQPPTASRAPARQLGQKPRRMKETFSDLESDDDVMNDYDSSGKKLVGQTSGEALLQAPGPSLTTFAAAQSLQKHRTLRKLLNKYWKKHSWPENDIGPDTLREYAPWSRESISEVEEKPPWKKARVDTHC